MYINDTPINHPVYQQWSRHFYFVYSVHIDEVNNWCNTNKQMHYSSVSQNLWDRGPVNYFFIRRGPSPNKFTRKHLSIFLSSYIKLT